MVKSAHLERPLSCQNGVWMSGSLDWLFWKTKAHFPFEMVSLISSSSDVLLGKVHRLSVKPLDGMHCSSVMI